MQNLQRFRNTIWTNHALEQLTNRKLSQELAYSAFLKPDTTKKGKEKDTFEYSKKSDGRTITVIAKQNEKSEWIILTCWVNPPYPGTVDARLRQEYQQYKKSSFWGKLWYVVKKQIGL